MPNLVFLMETKLHVGRVAFLKNKLGFDGCFVVDAVGRNGGQVLLWRREVEINIISYSQRHISGWVIDERTVGGLLLVSMASQM